MKTQNLLIGALCGLTILYFFVARMPADKKSLTVERERIMPFKPDLHVDNVEPMLAPRVDPAAQVADSAPQPKFDMEAQLPQRQPPQQQPPVQHPHLNNLDERKPILKIGQAGHDKPADGSIMDLPDAPKIGGGADEAPVAIVVAEVVDEAGEEFNDKGFKINCNLKEFNRTAPYDGIVDASDPNCYVPRFLSYDRCAPRYFILGPLKGGTTSMYKYLSKHPGVHVLANDDEVNPRVVRIKEPCWFDVDHLGVDKKENNNGADMEFKFERYLEYFPPIKPGEHMVTGEGSPNYIFNPTVPSRLKEVLPDARMILMARDPVIRAYSHVNHFMKVVNPAPLTDTQISLMVDYLVDEQLPLLQTCVDEHMEDSYRTIYDCFNRVTQRVDHPKQLPELLRPKSSQVSRARRFHFIERGIYYFQVKNYYPHFPKESGQLLVVNSDEFYANTSHVMKTVEDHIGLEHIDWTDIAKVRYNVMKDPAGKGGAGMLPEEAKLTKHPLSARSRYRLAKFYAPLNDKLEELIGREMWDYPLEQWKAEADAEDAEIERKRRSLAGSPIVDEKDVVHWGEEKRVEIKPIVKVPEDIADAAENN